MYVFCGYNNAMALRVVLVMLVLSFALWQCKHEPLQGTLPSLTDTTGSGGGGGGGGGNVNEIPCNPDTVYFANQILPLFIAHCGPCHSTSHDSTKDVVLTDYWSIINSADVEAFDPSHGKVIEVMTDNDPDDMMPPPYSGIQPMSSQNINLIIQWINQGALNNHCDECDTSNVSYSMVQPVFSSMCVSCHNGNHSSGINFNTYANAVAAVATGKVIPAIERTGPKPMPPGGPLTDCQLTKIKAWIAAGTPP